MKRIDPNTTPEGISLDEIRTIAQRNLDKVRFFRIDCRGHIISVVALPNVYLSNDFGDSRYYAEQVPEFVNGRFLEIGTGTGIVTIAAALANREYFGRCSEKYYVAIDINPQAVKNARINFMINGLEDRIDVRQGDVFDSLGENERFDCIFWAHPFHRGNTNEGMAMRACFDPLFQGLEKYVREGHRFLRKNGRLLLGSGNFADLDDMREIMDRYGRRMNMIHYIHKPFKGQSGEANTYNIFEIN